MTLHPCPVCDETAREAIYRTRDRHYKIPGEWTVARCTGCGLVQIDPMLRTEQLMPLYPADFYAYQDVARTENSLKTKLRRWMFSSLYVGDPSIPNPGRVLDSGCGTGWGLLEFKERGWECVGVEPSAAAAKFGRERYALDIKAGTVATQRFPDGHFDYIRANHSLEHDPEPGATLHEFRRILKAGGKLLIGVPNFNSTSARLFGTYWWYLGAPVHTYNFTSRHLVRLLARHGFEVESVRYCGNWGGLLGSLQIYLNRNHPGRCSTDGWVVNSRICRIAAQLISSVLNWCHRGDAIEVVAHGRQMEQAGFANT